MHMYEENDRECSNAEYEQIQEEHPLNMEFQSKIYANGNMMHQKQGCFRRITRNIMMR